MKTNNSLHVFREERKRTKIMLLHANTTYSTTIAFCNFNILRKMVVFKVAYMYLQVLRKIYLSLLINKYYNLCKFMLYSYYILMSCSVYMIDCADSPKYAARCATPYWISTCKSNAGFMEKYCRKSCGLCS